MSHILFTDGMVIDHVAEFCHLPASSLQTLYSLDRLGYIDAIARFLQVLAMSPTIAFAKGIVKPTTERLRGELKSGGKVDEETPIFSLLNHDARQVNALAQVHKDWNTIAKAIQEKPTILKALGGQVQREFRQCFLAPDAERQPMENYVQPFHARALLLSNRSSLLGSVQSLVRESKLQQNEVESWLDRMVTTHYRNFFEYGLYGLHEYTPALTRAELTFVLHKGTTEPFAGIIRCIAVDILETVKRREELAKRALDWSSKNKGQKLLNSFRQLRENFVIATAREKELLVRDIDAVLESPVRFSLGLVLGFMTALKGSEPKPDTVLATPPQLRWLYGLRQPRATLRLGDLVDRLVQG